MAKNNKRKNSQKQNRGSGNQSNQSKAWREVTGAAYRQGQIDAGLKNPNSAVSAAYKRGQDSVSNYTKPKRPLF